MGRGLVRIVRYERGAVLSVLRLLGYAGSMPEEPDCNGQECRDAGCQDDHSLFLSLTYMI